MCHYITLTTDCPDIGALNAVMKQYGRCATLQSNASIHGLLKNGERAFSSTDKCDCGTVLGKGEETETPQDMSKIVDRKRKAGWSKAKIDRWLADQGRAKGGGSEPLDSFETWAKIVADVLELQSTSTAGLIVHYYNGILEEEAFAACRREVRSDNDVIAALRQLREDELLVVRRSPQGRK